MRVILLPRGYEVDGARCLTYADACGHAASISTFASSAINVERDPLVKGGEYIEGEQTVARFVKGTRVFPID